MDRVIGCVRKRKGMGMEKEHDDIFDREKQQEPNMERREGEPTQAFKGAAIAALIIGISAYLVGLFNATMELNEKGYYFAVLLFGLYASVSLQKAVRDKEEGIPVTYIYYGISWFALMVAIVLMAIGLYNAGSIMFSEKGFFAMAFVLSIFAAITVQKNVRDTKSARNVE
ncbi:Inner membrane protein yiaA [Sporosarcina pasteurii]|uniref:Inner membrane protein yiaA n=2 Tax=Sporosarcina pasteurii TaxID=1474 RepID=A0A380C3U3_SPOPA|nr:Inner membrane protein yiaA [Sporosarcina pasteurii]